MEPRMVRPDTNVALPITATLRSPAFVWLLGVFCFTTDPVRELTLHVRFNKLTKYSLSNESGFVVHGPSYPDLAKWHRPSVCAPDSATISWSLKL